MNTKNKIFHLSSCGTCKKIIEELGLRSSCELQNIKETNISADELDFAAKKLGSYEALFNKKAVKYRQNGLHEKELTENEYRKLILEEYTFLKRPLMFIQDEVFAGNTKAVLGSAKQKLAIL